MNFDPITPLRRPFRWTLRSFRNFRNWLEQPSIFTKDNLRGASFEIGDYTYGCPAVQQLQAGAKLKIGRFSSIAGGVNILLGGEHRADWGTTYPFSAPEHPFIDQWPEATGSGGYPASKGDVVIGNDVWIGHGVTILSGVNIGDRAVVGAGAVVTSDVEPYSIVAGNLARLVRKRFDEDTILALLQIRWWDWPVDKLKQNIRLLTTSDVSLILSTTKRRSR